MNTRCALLLIVMLAARPMQARVIEVDLQVTTAPVSAATVRAAFAKASMLWRQCDVVFIEGTGPVTVKWLTIAPPHTGHTDVERAGPMFLSATVSISSALLGSAMERVLAHELGHVIGLSHSDNPASIMHPSALGRALLPMEKERCLGRK